MRYVLPLLALLLVGSLARTAQAQEADVGLPGDRMLAAYFRTETEKLAKQNLHGIDSPEEWKRRAPLLRQQLFEMLGLDPLPERTALNPVVTGVTEGPGFRVERLYFESLPQLYVTANFYLPEKIEGPLPTILYVCGHGGVKIGDVSYGNKVSYQHHGAWFARHGYACLVIDTLQLGEIEGMHHGLYRFDQWKWINHGYTPAGVEAWNCIRALDYLETRDEVDATRIGVTGRSGGGAYSWWITALDDRIRAAVPVAGITDLQDHVVNGCVEGHCDCMYFVNTYGWDYGTVAALAAPRALLIANTDRDSIFPLDGVMRIHHQARRIYGLLGASESLGVAITSGDHIDSQELQVPAFRWLNHALKNGDESLVDEPAIKYFEPEQLRVLHELPADQRNTRIQDEFVQLAGRPELPIDRSQWNEWRTQWVRDVREKCFRGWPGDDLPLNVNLVATWRHSDSAGQGKVRLEAYDYDVHPDVRLRFYVLRPDDDAPLKRLSIHVEDDATWAESLAALREPFADAFDGEVLPEWNETEWNMMRNTTLHLQFAYVFCCPRGVGRSRWTDDPDERKHIERRFFLLGQTLDGMQVYDIRRCIQAVRTLQGKSMEGDIFALSAAERMAGNVLYAALFESGIDGLDLKDLPDSHDEQGPYYLNVRRIWDLPQAAAVVGESTRITPNYAAPHVYNYDFLVKESLDGEANAPVK
jgi:dienelactone hydrolase